VQASSQRFRDRRSRGETVVERKSCAAGGGRLPPMRLRWSPRYLARPMHAPLLMAPTPASELTLPQTGPPYCARILLADDDGEMRRMVAQTLRQAGHEVVEVADGRQLVERVASDQALDILASLFELRSGGHRFDLVITDERMPGLTGREAIAWLQNDEAPPRVIVMTAFGDGQFRADALARGAAAVLSKPLELTELLGTVQRLLGEIGEERIPASGTAAKQRPGFARRGPLKAGE
jgi:CheY-like chemotaxis protein